MQPLYVILYNIRSAYNVGAILRTADGAGVQKVYLCGYTPTPIDRFGRARQDIAKVALGAEQTVAWEYVARAANLVTSLHRDGVEVVAVEQDVRSIPYTQFAPTHPTALVFGEEVSGIPQDILALCDHVVDIPMYGSKESLNVSVSVGIVVYAYRP